MTKFPITKQGFLALQEELKRLKYHDRPEVIREIATAREFGDLSENAEYQAAKEKQNFLEKRILKLERQLAETEVINISNLSLDTIKFGATVELLSEETNQVNSYQIVGEYEANINLNKLSIVSPMARALIGKSKGDVIEVQIPNNAYKYYKILSISYID